MKRLKYIKEEKMETDNENFVPEEGRKGTERSYKRRKMNKEN